MPLNMIEKRREEAGWIGFWSVVCQAVLDGATEVAHLDWLDRRLADLESLQVWLDVREHTVEHDPDDDPDEIHALLARDVDEIKGGKIWAEFVQLGIRRTVNKVRVTDNQELISQVMLDLATILYHPALLSDLEFAIFSLDPLPEEWVKIQAEVLDRRKRRGEQQMQGDSE